MRAEGGSLQSWIGFDKIDLISPMPYEQCIGSLRSRVRRDDGDTPAGAVVGEIGDTSFRIYWSNVGSPFVRQFMPVLYGELRSAGASTRITCRIAPSGRLAMRFACWASLAAAMLIVILRATNDRYATRSMSPALILAAMGVATAFAGWRPASITPGSLLEFVSNTLDATLSHRQ